MAAIVRAIIELVTISWVVKSTRLRESMKHAMSAAALPIIHTAPHISMALWNRKPAAANTAKFANSKLFLRRS